MNVNKININQSEPTYNIASDAYNVTYENSNVGEKLTELNEKVDTLALGTFYGFFPNSSSLPIDVTTLGYAYVGLDNPYNIWNFNGETWSDSGTSIDMNDADEEDMTRNADGKLQFKDRAYGDGMGYVILRKDKSFAEQMTKENTIYVIRYDFTLEKDITIPDNCVLKFDGGSISGNYTIDFNGCIINANEHYHIFSGITISNLKNFSIKWFGAKGDGTTDDTSIFQTYATLPYCEIIIPNGVYYITGTIKGSGYSSWVGRGHDNIYNLTSDERKIGRTTFKCVGDNNGNPFIYFPRNVRYIDIYAEGSIASSVRYSNSIGVMCGETDHFYGEGHIDEVEITGFSRGLYINNTYGYIFDKIRISYCNIGIFVNPIKDKSTDTGYTPLITFKHCVVTDCFNYCFAYTPKNFRTMRLICCDMEIAGDYVIALTDERGNLITTPSYNPDAWLEKVLYIENMYSEDANLLHVCMGRIWMDNVRTTNSDISNILSGALYITNSMFSGNIELPKLVEGVSEGGVRLCIKNSSVNNIIMSGPSDTAALFGVNVTIENTILREIDKNRPFNFHGEYHERNYGRFLSTLGTQHKGFKMFDGNVFRIWNGTKFRNTLGRTFAPLKGTTAERPTNLDNAEDVGYIYFDTNLGKPIFWKGSNIWVDATGTTV